MHPAMLPSDIAGRRPVAIGEDVVVSLASAFEQFGRVFEVAQTQLSKLAEDVSETSIEIGANISTEGNLIIVKGTAEASIKVTVKWQAPKPTGAAKS
jgi:Trypsin-co-occurring domain 1